MTGNYKKVACNSIQFLEAAGSSYTIYSKGLPKIVVSENMKAVLEKLHGTAQAYKFIRINKPVVVNSDYIEAIEGTQLILCRRKLKISNKYLHDYKKRFNIV